MQLVQPSATSTEPEFWPANAVPKKWIEKLFAHMSFAYGARFADMWRSVDLTGMKQHWGLKLAGFGTDELARGVAKLDSRDWPPTLPEFLKLCRPDIEPAKAYYEALSGLEARNRGEKGEWTHPAIYHAAMRVGSHDMQHLGFQVIRPRWERALADELLKAEWPAIKDPDLQLESSGPSEQARANAAAMLRNLEASGITKHRTSPFDHTRWAKDIKRRQEQGDTTLTALQIKQAEEALRQAGQ